MSDFKFHTPNSWILSSLPDIAGINMGQSPSSSDVNEQSEGIVFFKGRLSLENCIQPQKILHKTNKNCVSWRYFAINKGAGWTNEHCH